MMTPEVHYEEVFFVKNELNKLNLRQQKNYIFASYLSIKMGI